MIRKLFFAAVLVGTSLVAPPSHSAPVVKPCDVICGEDADPETVCACPWWTDRRVDRSTCALWGGYYGCWYF